MTKKPNSNGMMGENMLEDSSTDRCMTGKVDLPFLMGRLLLADGRGDKM
jgi:hypothetical protein